MKYMKQICIIMGISFLGELLKYLLPLPVPASIYGLLLMLAALLTGVIPLKAVEESADFLVEIMPMMFIPAGVGLMKEAGSLAQIWFPFTVIVVVSTVAVLGVTGRLSQWIIRRERGKKGKAEEK
ncbi:MAG: CidA/LrgA family protein [Lachnospiraceae bacterium]|nr:CidA/LrgA family protein [Lachnospiraceae bacterium]